MSNQTGHELIVEVKTHGFELPADEYGRVEAALYSLREAVDCFPVKAEALMLSCDSARVTTVAD